MKLDKQIKIYPGIDTDHALAILKNYIAECESKPRKNGYSGMIIYGMKTGEYLCVYKTETTYVIRTS